MTEKSENRPSLDHYPQISQRLRLTCRACGESEAYDVGGIWRNPSRERDADSHNYFFTNYFRCVHCGSAGPWDMADYLKLLGLTARAVLGGKSEALGFGQNALFDGTLIQTPAMGEQILLERLETEPDNAFLCSRLANLLRNCGEKSKAAVWDAKAIQLDPDDIESRHHLYAAALERSEIPAALAHMVVLTRNLLDGLSTEDPDLDGDIARGLAESWRKLPEPFRQRFLSAPQPGASSEGLFIRDLLSQQGDESAIVSKAVERLLAEEDASSAAALDLCPSLREVVETGGLNPSTLALGMEAGPEGGLRVRDRHLILVSDGEKAAPWHVPSLAALFRGSQLPPADIDQYPAAYCPHFLLVESHFLAACDAEGDRTDQEMEEIYSALRKRPDGRSLGEVHDLLWQAVALLLGTRAVSGAEYQGILGALVQSTRRWGVGPVSRNYAAFVRDNFEDDPG